MTYAKSVACLCVQDAFSLFSIIQLLTSMFFPAV